MEKGHCREGINLSQRFALYTLSEPFQDPLAKLEPTARAGQNGASWFSATPLPVQSVLSFFSDFNHIGRRWWCSYELLKKRWPAGKDWINIPSKGEAGSGLSHFAKAPESPRMKQALLLTESLAHHVATDELSHLLETSPSPTQWLFKGQAIRASEDSQRPTDISPRYL